LATIKQHLFQLSVTCLW